MTDNILGPAINEYDLMTDLLASGLNTVALMCTIAECNEFNTKMLRKQNSDILTVESIDVLEATIMPPAVTQTVQKRLKDLEKKQNDTGGLERNLKLCVNSRVMLRRNLNIELGLVNGAMGHVTAFFMDESNAKPMFIQVQFLNLKEPTLIPRSTARFKLFQDVYVRRSQFPLCAAYAITVHKSQGLSLDSAIVNVGSTVFNHGIVYVALSRVTKLSGLYLTKFDSTKLTADSTCIAEYNRLRKMYAPHLALFEVPIPTTTKRVFTDTIVKEQAEDIKEEVDSLPQKKKRKMHHLENNSAEEQEISLSGFSNFSGIDCYCNSTLQFLFEINSLCEDMKKKKSKPLSNNLTETQIKQTESGGNPFSVYLTRHIVYELSPDRNYLLFEQQDAHEFLNSIFKILQAEGVPVRQSVEISYSWKEYCRPCKLTQTPGSPHELCLLLPLPEKGDVKFIDLLENVNHGSLCSKCGNLMKSSLFSVQSNEYVILMFGIYNNQGVRKQIAIKEFNHSRVLLGKQKFETKALIVHEGTTIRSGHFIAWKRREKYWLKCDDSVITKQLRAPYNMENVYLLLLQKKL